MAEIRVHAGPPDPELLGLLAEWFEYWDTAPEMPAKMPSALHVRTALALTKRGATFRFRRRS